MSPPAYRRGVGIVLIDRRGHVFVGSRTDARDAWQMPQGGIDEGEQPVDAAWRELREEAGTRQAQLLGEAPGWLTYDLPPEVAARIWGGRFRGQEQKWFAMRFTGRDEDIDLDAHKAEFSRWRWAAPEEVVAGIVPFKREVYRRVMEAFAPHLVPEEPLVKVLALDHVNLVCRPDEEAATLAFYRDVLGLEEVEKPAGRRRQGGWFRLGDRSLHLSVEAGAPAPRGHVALRVASLAEARAALCAAGADLREDPRPPRDGSLRLFARDPAGNLIELLAGPEPA